MHSDDRRDVLQRSSTLVHDAPSVWDDVKYAMLTLGLIGVFHILLTWPGIIILDYAGVETFEWPAHDALVALLTTTFLDSIFNVLLLIGIALTSALFMSVGCLLTIPASMLSDWVLHGTVMQGGSIGGVVLIAAGFAVLAWAEVLEARHASQKRAASEDAIAKEDDDRVKADFSEIVAH